jgi:D-amino-acid dehydrogenase
MRGGPVALPLREIGAWLPFALPLLSASGPRRFEAGKAALTDILAQALPAWQRLLTAADALDLLIESGHFVVWESEATAAAGRAAWAAASTGTARLRNATSEELQMLTRLLARPPAGAIRFEGTAHIADPTALAEALGDAFAQAGGTQRCAAARGLKVVDGKATIILDDGEPLRADAVIVAAGVASPALLAPLGHKVPLIAERGYHIRSTETEWPAHIPPVVFEDRSIIVTRFRSGLRIAGFVEFAGAASPPDPRKWTRLRAHAQALGLPFAPPGEPWMGARPTLPDYLPAIGRSHRASNLFYAFGHQHLGLTLAAVTGEAVGALVAGDTPPIDLGPFSLNRFNRRRKE